MRYAARSISFTRHTAKNSLRGGISQHRSNQDQQNRRQRNHSQPVKRQARRARGIHTYWAELGFLLMAIFFLKPEWAQTVVATVATVSNVTPTTR